MVKIGLKKAYVARMSADVAGTSVTYDVPVSLLAVQQAAVNPRVSSVQVPGDDIIQEDLSECLGADGTVQRKEMTPAEEALLLGRPTDNDGGVYGGNFDDAPYFAFGYMRTFKGSNVGLYVWILKTKFRPSNSTADTKPVDNITPQYDTLSFSSITREADGAWIYSIKSSEANFADTFFTKATLEKLANTANQIYGQPAEILGVAALPATGIPGIVYHLTTDNSFHYWNGSAFMAIEVEV